MYDQKIQFIVDSDEADNNNNELDVSTDSDASEEEVSEEEDAEPEVSLNASIHYMTIVQERTIEELGGTMNTPGNVQVVGTVENYARNYTRRKQSPSVVPL